jgi:hypothetical protein
MSEHRFTIDPRGPFDFSRSIGFLEEWPVTQGQAEDSVLRFSFCASTTGDRSVYASPSAAAESTSTQPDRAGPWRTCPRRWRGFCRWI